MKLGTRIPPFCSSRHAVTSSYPTHSDSTDFSLTYISAYLDLLPLSTVLLLKMENNKINKWVNFFHLLSVITTEVFDEKSVDNYVIYWPLSSSKSRVKSRSPSINQTNNNKDKNQRYEVIVHYSFQLLLYQNYSLPWLNN